MKKFLVRIHGEPDGGRSLRVISEENGESLMHYDAGADFFKRFVFPDNLEGNKNVELICMTLDEYIDLSKRVCGESD